MALTRDETPRETDAQRLIDEIMERAEKTERMIELRADEYRKSIAYRFETVKAEGEPSVEAEEASDCANEAVSEPPISAKKAETGPKRKRGDSSAALERIRRIADDVAQELPREFYEKLTGGIALTDSVKLHAKSDPRRPLLVLGEYRYDPRLGRSIMLYGGSIIRRCKDMGEEELKNELERIIKHEFTHHIESLCGERGLEIDDEIQLLKYKEENEKRYNKKVK